MIGHHHDTAGGEQHLAHPRHFLGGSRIERLHFAAQHGTLRERGVQHSGQFDVETKLGAAVDLARCIDAGQRLADNLEIGLGF